MYFTKKDYLSTFFSLKNTINSHFANYIWNVILIIIMQQTFLYFFGVVINSNSFPKTSLSITSIRFNFTWNRNTSYLFHTIFPSIRVYMYNSSHFVCDMCCFYSWWDMSCYSYYRILQISYTLYKTYNKNHYHLIAG